MTRLISADRLKTYIQMPGRVMNPKTVKTMLKYIDKQPAVKVMPMRPAHWILDKAGEYHICSNCGEPAFRYMDGRVEKEHFGKHCENCGAEMQG